MTAPMHLYADGPSSKGGAGLEVLLEMVARSRPAWHADAACLEHPEVNFFPGRGESLAPAKAICAGCLCGTSAQPGPRSRTAPWPASGAVSAARGGSGSSRVGVTSDGQTGQPAQHRQEDLAAATD